jgi:hypothetical protein
LANTRRHRSPRLSPSCPWRGGSRWRARRGRRGASAACFKSHACHQNPRRSPSCSCRREVVGAVINTWSRRVRPGTPASCTCPQGPYQWRCRCCVCTCRGKMLPTHGNAVK